MNLQKQQSLIFEVIIFLINLKIIWSQARFYATKTATKCFAISGESELQFSPCKPGHMILIEEAFQGTSQILGSCEYQYGDCISPVIAETEARLYRCIGSSDCRIPITQTWIPKCQAYSDYVTVLYKCIAAEDVTDICTTQVREIYRTGYIKSYGYPSDYEADIDCQCNITTDFDQKILLTFSDFAVEWSEDCYSDVLEIRDGYYEYARCGRVPRNHNLTSHTNKMEINFQTDKTQQHKGFWLQVEALGDIKISCASKKPLKDLATTTVSPTTPEGTTQSDITTATPFAPTFIPKFRPRPSKKSLETLKPTKNIPIFGSTNYKISIDDEYLITGKHSYDDQHYENEVIKPTVQGIIKKGKDNSALDNLDEQFDLLLTQNFFNRYVTNLNTGDFGGQLGGYDNYGDEYTTGGPDNEKVKPNLVISPMTGIIIGCVLLVVIIIILICVCVWRKRHRRKKAITTKNDKNEPKLTKHSYPSQVNSPRPSTSDSMHSHQYQTSPPRQYMDSSSPHFNDNITTQYPENLSRQYPDSSCRSFPPESPAASARSFESDNSFESGRSGLRRGERVKKHYKRSRMSPRLDTAHYPSREEMDQIQQNS